MVKSELFPRLATGAVLILVTCFFVSVDRIFLFFAVELAILLGSLEFFRIVNPKGSFYHNFLGVTGGLLIGLGFYIGHPVPLLVIPLLVILSLQLIKRTPRTIESAAVTTMGVFYPALFLAHMLPLRGLGVSYAFIPLLYTWVFDTSAYLIGSKFGRRRIAPRISPNKSLEGTVGGLIISILAGIFAKHTFAPFLSIPHVLMLGLIISLSGQLGDLFESLLKRSVEVKDSSSLLPGHGGILDRIDSLIFTIPVSYYYFLWVMR